MKSKEFIEAKLNELYFMFDNVQIRYEFRANTISHIIEIIPLSFFDCNEDYMRSEAKIEDEFEALFPQENIVFISEGSLTEIRNIDLVLGYDTIKFNNEGSCIDFVVDGFNDNVKFQEFNNYALAA